MDWLDSLYMTVITLATVGFEEVHPLSHAGKVFTIALILIGVTSLAYAAARITETLLEGGLLRRRRMLSEIRHLQGHVVVCGYGRMGGAVVRDLLAHGASCVVVEKDPERVKLLEGERLLHVVGDATDDECLVAAGVERAKALATVLPHDADNLFVTVTARSLNSALTIVARAGDEKNVTKLQKAGANHVFNPYQSGGRMVARQLLHPSVTKFIEVVSQGIDAALALEEVLLRPGSSLIGSNLREAPIRREMDIVVVGVRRRDGEFVFNPSPDLSLAEGDTLVALGRRENLVRLERLAEGPHPR